MFRSLIAASEFAGLGAGGGTRTHLDVFQETSGNAGFLGTTGLP